MMCDGRKRASLHKGRARLSSHVRCTVMHDELRVRPAFGGRLDPTVPQSPHGVLTIVNRWSEPDYVLGIGLPLRVRKQIR